MDVSRTAETALAANRAALGQDVSVAMLKQQLTNQEASLSLVEATTEQVKAMATEASASAAHAVDIEA